MRSRPRSRPTACPTIAAARATAEMAAKLAPAPYFRCISSHFAEPRTLMAPRALKPFRVCGPSAWRRGPEDWSAQCAALEQDAASFHEDVGPPDPEPRVGDTPPGLGDDPAVVMVIRLVWRQRLATLKAKFFSIRGHGAPSNLSHS